MTSIIYSLVPFVEVLPKLHPHRCSRFLPFFVSFGKDLPYIASGADVGLLRFNNLAGLGLVLVLEAVTVLVANDLHDRGSSLMIDKREANL